MPARKYPLDPLARLRAKQVDDAARLLSDAVRARQEAESREQAALLEREGAAEEARSVRQGEHVALERGELLAGDLARAAAWDARARAEGAALDGRAIDAGERAREAHGREGAARDGVARARADAAAVERDRAKWETLARKKEEAAEEEESAEAFRGKPS